MVKTTGLGGATIAAGCLGDDDDTDDGDAADFDDEDTVDPDDGDAEDIEEEDVVLHDITAIQHRGGDPLPGDANHFRNGDGPAPFWSGHHEGH